MPKAHRAKGHSLAAACEALLAHALDGVGEALRIPVGQTSKIERAKHLGAQPYECNAARLDYADGFEPKTVLTRVSEATFDVP
jgi:putative transposase